MRNYVFLLFIILLFASCNKKPRGGSDLECEKCEGTGISWPSHLAGPFSLIPTTCRACSGRGYFPDLGYKRYVSENTEDEGEQEYISEEGDDEYGYDDCDEDKTPYDEEYITYSCPDCGGSGKIACPVCNGLGFIGFEEDSRTCGNCEGRPKKFDCNKCNQSGTITLEKGESQERLKSRYEGNICEIDNCGCEHFHSVEDEPHICKNCGHKSYKHTITWD